MGVNICLFVCLLRCFFVSLFVSLFVCLSVCLFFICLFVCLFACLFVRLFVKSGIAEYDWREYSDLHNLYNTINCYLSFDVYVWQYLPAVIVVFIKRFMLRHPANEKLHSLPPTINCSKVFFLSLYFWYIRTWFGLKMIT